MRSEDDFSLSSDLTAPETNPELSIINRTRLSRNYWRAYEKANLSTTQASEMMEISRSLLCKLEHGKNMSTEKLADIIAYYIAFIEENSEVKISCREILNEIIMQASPFS